MRNPVRQNEDEESMKNELEEFSKRPVKESECEESVKYEHEEKS